MSSSNSVHAIQKQVVLVTGGARGLGAAITRAFLNENARVVINYHQSAQAAKALAALHPDRALPVQADVTDLQSVRALVEHAQEHFGQPITTVINNALPQFSFDADGRAMPDTLKAAELMRQFEGVVVGALHTVQATLAGMKQQGFGRIVNIGTNLFQHPVVPYHDYTAANAALLSFTRTLANDLGPFGITVHMVSGGLLRTTDASAATPPAVFDLIAENTPLRKVTTPEEFADTALFFASPWSRAVTGQNLLVDGGLVKG